jgi:hypothetical protein
MGDAPIIPDNGDAGSLLLPSRHVLLLSRMQDRAGGEGNRQDDAKLPERAADSHDLQVSNETVKVHRSSSGRQTAAASFAPPVLFKRDVAEFSGISQPALFLRAARDNRKEGN